MHEKRSITAKYYRVPFNNHRAPTRGEESPALKVGYDRSRLGDPDCIAGGCGALLTTENGDLIFTPGYGYQATPDSCR